MRTDAAGSADDRGVARADGTDARFRRYGRGRTRFGIAGGAGTRAAGGAGAARTMGPFVQRSAGGYRRAGGSAPATVKSGNKSGGARTRNGGVEAAIFSIPATVRIT